ncbi:MAG: alpha/beta hydrolase [Clostridiales bacterium]|nr:alpha/beta hydrolase [Clostridiales bacterium]
MKEVNVNTEDIIFNSSNHMTLIKGKIFVPQVKNIKGIIQISHGMCEHIDRYEPFIKMLNSNGFIVGIHNHLGHGSSIISDEHKGYFADRFGYKCLIKDLYSMTKIIKEKFPNVPLILFGHSMGSFITRNYLSEYGKEIDGVILSGTMGPNPFVDVGIKLCNVLIKQKGPLYRSEKLTDMGLELVFNHSIKHNTTKFDWLSRDINEVKRYNADEITDFTFTVSAYKDLLNLIKYANSEKVIQNIPKKLPIFIMSGDKDPVGNNGEGVEKVYTDMINAGLKNVNMKLYKNGRHEMINEINQEKVYKDILNWIKNKVLIK